MNELITLLALKASNPKTGWLDRQKFAKLIVRECEQTIKSVPTHFEAQDKIILECLKAIKEHFGVE